jgi:hypothetical protein
VRKTRKRLTLNRETLVELDRTELRPANGATGVASGCYGCPSATCMPPCEYSHRNTCTTCQATCTTNFC